jgi:hypothetical protein
MDVDQIHDQAGGALVWLPYARIDSVVAEAGRMAAV